MRANRIVAILIILIACAIALRTARRHALNRARWALTSPHAVAPAQSSAQPPDTCKVAVGYRVMHVENRVVAVWYPTSSTPSRYDYSPKFSSTLAKDGPATTACGATVPLIVFSHGDLGCGLQSVTLTEELARHGYVVAAPDHADAALCHTVPPPTEMPAPPPQQPKILDPQAWDENSRRDRQHDIEAVIDTLLNDPEFKPVIDPEKIGLAGHSLGGYTAVGIAGGWQSWLDPRVRAVLALSPYVMPFQVKSTLQNVHVPLMYQGGTLDVGITPFLKGQKGAYAMANPPAYYVEFPKAAHFAWVNCEDQHTTESCLSRVANARLIAEYAVAFFDRHLKRIQEPLLDQNNPQLAEYVSKQQ